jgi:SAM-dependent methyltransferase
MLHTPDLRLTIPETDRRRHSPGNVVAVCLRQWRTERDLARRGIRFRSTDPDEVAAAYGAMRPEEFDAVNGRQAWANWRTTPRALSGHLPDRPLRVIDLGCGSGASTQVLAVFCPAGSEVIGYELAPGLCDVARRRRYRHRGGAPVKVRFVCQPVTEPLADPDGGRLADGSVDLVNASGVVGHHLTGETVRPLIDELRRVVAPGGLALLDVGPKLGDKELSRLMAAAGFRRLRRHRSWLFDPTGQVAYRKDG